MDYKKKEGIKMEKDLMRNFSISVYRRTRERYLDFKNENELTHDETIKLLLDKYEEEEKMKVSKGERVRN